MLDLPEFGVPDRMPRIPAETYAARLETLRERMAARSLDVLVVYADREHSANLAYLTGFDPRFEEALLVVAADGEPALLVGNENWGTGGAAPAMPQHSLPTRTAGSPSEPTTSRVSSKRGSKPVR